MAIHKVLILSLLLLSCHKSQNNEGKQPLPAAQQMSEDLPFDSLEVKNTLSFNSEDLLFIHQPRYVNDYVYCKSELLTRKIISSNMKPFDFRSIITVYRTTDDNNYGSYVLLYRSNEGNSNIERIRQDSIELSLGNLDMFAPEIKIVDLNYDGYKDIVLSFDHNTSGRNGYNYFWTFNPTINQFAPDSVLYEMFHEQAIYIDESKKEISAGGGAGVVSLYFENYRWNGIKYESFSRDRTEYNDDATYIVSYKEEYKNGNWVIIEKDSTNNE